MFKAILLSLALVLAGSTALAQVSCNQRDKIVDWLAHKYKEAPVAAGINNKGALIEVLSSEDGNTWTILLTAPNGTSCIVETGQAWQSKTYKIMADEPQA